MSVAPKYDWAWLEQACQRLLDEEWLEVEYELPVQSDVRLEGRLEVEEAYDLIQQILEAHATLRLTINVTPLAAIEPCELTDWFNHANDASRQKTFDAAKPALKLLLAAARAAARDPGTAASPDQVPRDSYNGVEWTNDYTKVKWGNLEFEFIHGRQSKIIGILIEDWRSGGSGVATGDIARQIKAASSWKMREAFRKKGGHAPGLHRAFHGMLTCTERRWSIAPPQ